jgi:hypothetical protein
MRFQNLQSLPTEQPPTDDDHYHRVGYTEPKHEKRVIITQPLIREYDSGSEPGADINVEFSGVGHDAAVYRCRNRIARTERR